MRGVIQLGIFCYYFLAIHTSYRKTYYSLNVLFAFLVSELSRRIPLLVMKHVLSKKCKERRAISRYTRMIIAGGVGKGIGVTVDGVNWIHLIVGRTSSLMFVVSSKKITRIIVTISIPVLRT